MFSVFPLLIHEATLVARKEEAKEPEGHRGFPKFVLFKRLKGIPQSIGKPPIMDGLHIREHPTKTDDN